MASRVGELSKDLDAFYTIFIKQFHALEREIIAKSVSTAAAANEPDNGASQISPQLKEILTQISM